MKISSLILLSLSFFQANATADPQEQMERYLTALGKHVLHGSEGDYPWRGFYSTAESPAEAAVSQATAICKAKGYEGDGLGYLCKGILYKYVLNVQAKIDFDRFVGTSGYEEEYESLRKEMLKDSPQLYWAEVQVIGDEPAFGYGHYIVILFLKTPEGHWIGLYSEEAWT